MSSPTLLETMRLVNGQVPLLPYHQERVDRSRRIYYTKSPALRLRRVLDDLALPREGIRKLRLLYGAGLYDYTVTEYEIRPIESLRALAADDLRYGRKYADRSRIEHLFEQRGDCDDVLMVQRGHVTDTSYANVAFFDGQQWYTPAWPLLPGARRAALIDRGVLRPTIIRVRDLHHFQSVRLLNAMMEWEQGPTLPVTSIHREGLFGVE